MKSSLLILFVIFASGLSAQKTNAAFPTLCKDTIILDEICLDCAEDYCFGGALFLERYLDSRLYLLLKKEKLTTSDIAIAITIDTFGVAKSVDFVSKDSLCNSCNEIIFEAISSINRWKPACSFSFDISENRMICYEKKLILYTKIIDSNVFINGRRERPLLYKK
ncbi:MAG: hypothetical protein Q7T20_06795 [Saprospiraceae bacterium]|nr:hypothetical protein [Saprospiraceae bacterium]